MVNRQRLVDEFLELVRIDSLSHHERKMADTLKLKLRNMGYEPFEDNAGEKTGGDAGNIICNVKGSKNVPAVMVMAHMDTVVPGLNKTPVIEGNIIKTDGKTVLGGDDAAGIVSILEAIRLLNENNIEHGDIQVVFTIAEEGGLYGSKNLDYSKIYAKYGLVLDADGAVGTVAVSGPSQNHIDVIVKGKASHAGLAPEKGINAVQIVAEAVSNMKLGRIDEETTANIGIISGGQATNIVCERVEIRAEARSRNQEKLKTQTNHMKECFEKAAAKFGGSVEFTAELAYPSYNINENDKLIGILKKAAGVSGLEFKTEATGGGSDTNIINGRGILAVDMSIGMDKVHSVEEQISIDDMVKTADYLVEIIKQVE